MKEEDLSTIKRYPIVEYLERKGIKPMRRTPSYAMYRSPLRAETHPSFKVDTEKNLWIDYAEGRGGSIIDLCMRLEDCTLSEAIRRLGQNASDNTVYSSHKDFTRILCDLWAGVIRHIVTHDDLTETEINQIITDYIHFTLGGWRELMGIE